MNTTRRRYSAEFKFQVALDAAKGQPYASPTPPLALQSQLQALACKRAGSRCGFRRQNVKWSWRRGEGIETYQVGKAPGAENNTLR
jgi:hypothetical protein